MRRTLSPALALLFAVSVIAPAMQAAPAAAAPAQKSVVAKIDTYLRGLVRTDAFDGTVLIAREGQVLLDRGYGLASIRHNLRDTAGTRFRIFDLTRQFTAMAVLQLQDEGKLSVQDTLCSYISSCPGEWLPITLHQLLSDSSGIPDFTTFHGFKFSKVETPAQILAKAMTKPLSFEPGTRFGYSSTDYLLLGLVIEKASGESYGSFLQDHIFSPLGLTGTGLLRDGLGVAHLATGYENHQRAQSVDATTPWSAGGMYSTVGDLYAWDQALDTNKLATAASLQAMFTPYFAVPQEPEIGYGYGWLIGPLWKHDAVFHGGGSFGYQAINLVFPKDKLTLLVLSNQGNTDVGSIESYIVPRLLPSS